MKIHHFLFVCLLLPIGNLYSQKRDADSNLAIHTIRLNQQTLSFDLVQVGPKPLFLQPYSAGFKDGIMEVDLYLQHQDTLIVVMNSRSEGATENAFTLSTTQPVNPNNRMVRLQKGQKVRVKITGITDQGPIHYLKLEGPQFDDTLIALFDSSSPTYP